MPDYLSALNDEQILCVQATEGPVLVLAGAGSGKTRVLTYRIANLIKNKNVNPSNIIAITFTNKAAGEMKERLEAMNLDAESMWVCTIHGMCNRILRKFIDRLGYGKSFSIYSEDDKDRVLKRIIEGLVNKDDNAYETIFKDAKYNISRAKNEFLSPEEYLNSGFDCKNFELICKIYGKYEEELKKSNALDFDDLIIKTYKLFLENRESLEYYQNKFEYIHIDEFQDTSVVQYNLIKILAGKHKNIFAVGDDDQSIYGWRGAEVENIFRFQKDFENTRVFKLQRNYRSTKKILSLANCIIKNNTVRMEKELWTQNGEGVRAERFIADNENGEAYYVASVIRSLMAYNGYKPSDCAVLIRLNALSRPFEQEFLNYGISYRVYGGYKFYERKEIKDIISYIRLLVNPFDTESLLRIINFPKRGIGAGATAQLEEKAKERGMKLFDVILKIDGFFDIPSSLAKKVSAFKDIIKEICFSYETEDKAGFIRHMLDCTGINAAYSEDTEENINRRLNIDEFVNSFIEYFKSNPESELDDYLTSVTLISDIDSMDESGVSIATVHSVKGLEFKAVFICGLDDGLFPVSRAYNEPKDLEEERRLMYVAITRAKERLYLTRAKSRFLYGERKYTVESKFLKELSGFFEAPKPREDAFYQNETGKREKPFAYGSGFNPRQPAAEKKKTVIYNYKIGDKVYHDKFGEGVIIKISGEGGGAIADIAFPRLGVKTFTLKFAPLKPVNT